MLKLSATVGNATFTFEGEITPDLLVTIFTNWINKVTMSSDTTAARLAVDAGRINDSAAVIGNATRTLDTIEPNPITTVL